MPLSKRRRLFTPKKQKSKQNIKDRGSIENEVATARGRLKGALREMLEPTAEESDSSSEYTPVKRERKVSQLKSESSSDEEEQVTSRKSPQRQSYVLKLFDRSVDLSQFSEDSPLYPICRAWITNQPKANYKEFGKKNGEPVTPTEDTLELPGPEGPPVSKIPDLIPEQKACSKDNINLNYREAPPPSKEQLIRWHSARWANVRAAWLQRAHEAEARYSTTQTVLNKINVKYIQGDCEILSIIEDAILSNQI